MFQYQYQIKVWNGNTTREYTLSANSYDDAVAHTAAFPPAYVWSCELINEETTMLMEYREIVVRTLQIEVPEAELYQLEELYREAVMSKAERHGWDSEDVKGCKYHIIRRGEEG